MRNFDSFMIGINRVDPQTFDSDLAQRGMEELLEKYDKVLASEEFKIFIPYRNIFTKFCLLSLLYKDLNKIKDDIQAKEKKINEFKKEVETI